MKDRVTILVGAAMDGHKFKPLAIGKSLNPRCFKNVDRSTLPVHYYANNSAWMDRDIMKDWFYNLFLPEVRQRYGTRQIILTLDNAGFHPPTLGVSVSQVEVRYLPANTTPLIQPMDQGAIYTLKYHFQSLHYERCLQYVMANPNHVDPLVPYYKSYTLLDAITDIGKSWDHVSEDVIHKCFEELLPPEKFMEDYNAKHSTNEEWPANIFCGFDAGPKGDNEWERREAEKEDDRMFKVNCLHEILSKQEVYIFDTETRS